MLYSFSYSIFAWVFLLGFILLKINFYVKGIGSCIVNCIILVHFAFAGVFGIYRKEFT